MREEFVSRKQVNLLIERIRKVEETNAAKELLVYMSNSFKKSNCSPHIMVVGAGSSYPATIFAKHALEQKLKMCIPTIEVVTPQTAIRVLTQFDWLNNGDLNPKYDLVIGFSYSGKTPNIKHVAEICSRKGTPFLLITGAEKSTLADLYHERSNVKIISYYNEEDSTGKERSMVSMFSTLAPVIVFNDFCSCGKISENQESLIIGEKFAANLNIPKIAIAIKRCPVIHVFYEYDTLPTAVDIKSKFAESGIANVVLHEKKNLLYGHYAALYTQKFAAVINLTRYSSLRANSKKTYKNKYDKNLAAFLAKRCEEKSANYIEIGTDSFITTKWNLEAMSMLPYFIPLIGEELGIDISKPLNPFPKQELLTLYNCKEDF